MKTWATALVVVAAAFLIPNATAADAKDLVGSWVVEKTEGDPPKGTVIEFTKEGKLKVTIKQGDKTETVEGTYKVDKDSLEVVVKDPQGKEDKEAVTIKEVTKDKLVIVTKDKKEIELKKK